MNDTNATFSDTELVILRTLVDSPHSNNAMSDRGNTRDITNLLRKLNVLTDHKEARDE